MKENLVQSLDHVGSTTCVPARSTDPLMTISYVPSAFSEMVPLAEPKKPILIVIAFPDSVNVPGTVPNAVTVRGKLPFDSVQLADTVATPASKRMISQNRRIATKEGGAARPARCASREILVRC